MDETVTNAHVVLGVQLDASLDEVRRAYLKLVREFPPDREPVRFRQIHAAYQLLNDPLSQAQAMLTPLRTPPDLTEVIAAADLQRPRLPNLFLLALGNQD